MPERERPRVGEILLQAGVIDRFQLQAALGEQTRWGRPLGATLIKLGFIGEIELVRALAGQLSLPMAALDGKRIPPEVLALVPKDVAHRSMVIPLFVKQEGGRGSLFLGVEDPGCFEVFDDLAFRTGMQIKPVMVAPSDLAAAIDRSYANDATEAPPVRPASVVTPGTEELARHWSRPADEAEVVLPEHDEAPEQGDEEEPALDLGTPMPSPDIPIEVAPSDAAPEIELEPAEAAYPIAVDGSLGEATSEAAVEIESSAQMPEPEPELAIESLVEPPIELAPPESGSPSPPLLELVAEEAAPEPEPAPARPAAEPVAALDVFAPPEVTAPPEPTEALESAASLDSAEGLGPAVVDVELVSPLDLSVPEPATEVALEMQSADARSDDSGTPEQIDTEPPSPAFDLDAELGFDEPDGELTPSESVVDDIDELAAGLDLPMPEDEPVVEQEIVPDECPPATEAEIARDAEAGHAEPGTLERTADDGSVCETSDPNRAARTSLGLRAIMHLLVEKGVLTREEIEQKVRALEQADEAEGRDPGSTST